MLKPNLAEAVTEYTYGQQYMYTEGVQFKSKTQHTGTAGRPSRRLCYRPALFFRHLTQIAL